MVKKRTAGGVQEMATTELLDSWSIINI